MKMKKNKHTIELYLDEFLVKDCLRYDFYMRNFVKVLTVKYSREGKKKQVNLLCYLPLLLHKKIGHKFKIITRKRLTDNQKEKIHLIFPFMDQYSGMKDFDDYFKGENISYPYKEYEECKRIAFEILKTEYFDNRWHIAWGITGSPFITVCWQNESQESSVVVMNNRVFYSNCRAEEIDRAEQNNVIINDCPHDIRFMGALFTKAYPDSHLNTYINSGGTRIFHFLRSQYSNDKAFELLGKSGLGTLADQLESFEKINLSATKPSDIFGLPLKLLKYLNDNIKTISMTTLKEREALYFAWKEAPEVFDRPLAPIDILWINFIQATKEDELFKTQFIADIPLDQTLKYLHYNIEKGYTNDYGVFTLYENYIMYSQRLGFWGSGRFPEDLQLAVKESVNLLNEIYETEKKSRFENTVLSPDYQKMMDEISEEECCICAPISNEELVCAGQKLHMSMKNYSWRILRGDVIIGLVFKRHEEKKSLIGLIEIEKHKFLTQAKSFSYKKFAKNERNYIIQYAKRKQLDYSRCLDL